MPYELYQPQGYDPAKKYPLVLILHYSGSDGKDEAATYLFRWSTQAKYPAFVVIPQSECTYYCWGGAPADWGKDPQEAHGRMAVELVDSLVSSLSIDPQRLYITGMSMGGWGSWDIVQRFPTKFAAVLATDAAGDPARAERILGMRLWNCEGDNDLTHYGVPTPQIEQARAMRDRLQALGAKDFRYTEIPGGHGSGGFCYDDPAVPDWMFGAVNLAAPTVPGMIPESTNGTGGAAGSSGSQPAGGSSAVAVGGTAPVGGSSAVAVGGTAPTQPGASSSASDGTKGGAGCSLAAVRGTGKLAWFLIAAVAALRRCSSLWRFARI